MIKFLVLLLVILIIGNLFGLYAYYKYTKTLKSLRSAQKSIEKQNDVLDSFFSKRMVFLHHSVGQGILNYGGLADSLIAMGIMVKSCTYGDEIGEKTDSYDWLPKFQNNMEQILRFKNHPNSYYDDSRANDIVMFKSCFPNSNLESNGTEPGDPYSRSLTLANNKAIFENLKTEIGKYKDKLFIYMTTPPLVPEATTPENARRAREFSQWLVNDFSVSYIQETGLSNFIVFDLFDILADEDNYLKAEYRLGRKNNSHPNTVACKVAAEKFMEYFRPVWIKWQSVMEVSAK